MQLHVARLCLDCEEVHEAQRCPACASESFAYLTRWIPAPDRRSAPRSRAGDPGVDRDRLDAVRRLVSPRVLTGSVVGMTALGVLGWLWRRDHGGAAESEEEPPASQRDETEARDRS
jgi:hypothetical protein